MADGVYRGLLSRSIEEVWARTLAQTPNLLGQLVWLSSLRDKETARYEHHGLSSRFSEETAQETILASHHDVFRRWIAQGLAGQKRHLQEYLRSLPEPPSTIVHRWLSVSFYRSWMPVGTPEHEQQLYLTDFETLLQIISRESDFSAQSPKPSPRP